MRRELTKFLTHLQGKYPLPPSAKVKLMVPHSITWHGMQIDALCTVNHAQATIRVASGRSREAMLTNLAHEYRHAYQFLVQKVPINTGEAERDAYSFSSKEVLNYGCKTT